MYVLMEALGDHSVPVPQVWRRVRMRVQILYVNENGELVLNGISPLATAAASPFTCTAGH